MFSSLGAALGMIIILQYQHILNVCYMNQNMYSLQNVCKINELHLHNVFPFISGSYRFYLMLIVGRGLRVNAVARIQFCPYGSNVTTTLHQAEI
jgi:hypothetical protein